MGTTINENIIRFRSRIGKLTIALMIFSIGVMLIPVVPMFLKEINLVSALILCVISVLVGLLLWMVFGTWYELSPTHILYYSGPLKGKIEINSIHTIISGKTLWVGYKPATARKGLIVKYAKYDEIYLSPKTNESFIKVILKIKPDIKIIDSTEV